MKDLVLQLTGSVGDDAALAEAVALAQRHAAHLAAIAIMTRVVPIGFEFGAMPSGLYVRMQDEERERAQALLARARTRLQASPISWEVRTAESILQPPGSTSAMHARHADLSILGAARNGERLDWIEDVFVDLLMDSGRPVLLVPPQYRARDGQRHGVIAWQPTRESTRALHDALPLLRELASIDVLTIDPKISEAGHGEEPGAEIAAHLARHGISVRLVQQSSAGESVGTAILRHVRESGAELLVAGGYSRSHFRQQILGGTTRTLFEQSPVPVLFSH